MRTEHLLLALLVACSSSAPPPARPAPPANKCAFVADHLLSLMSAAAKDAPADELDRVRGELFKRCTDDGWSATAQDCFLGLTAKEEVDRCAAQLTESQRDQLEGKPPPTSAK